MSSATEGLLPQLLWKHFAGISEIPRCSKNEEAVRNYVLKIAEENGLTYKLDDVKSVVVRKPATAGFENAPIVCLQSHLDMVCEKNKDTVHNFATDPIRLVKDGEWLRADGTTLGADNGIGVAASLAVMEATDLQHGPLEFLFTVDEETGLTGAINLGEDMLEGRILLNMDSEEDGHIYIGCAGGKDSELFFSKDVEDVPEGYSCVRIRVGGLQGGHSGLQIDQGLGNAVKLCARLVWQIVRHSDARLAYIDGGSKHNAIPRECDAFIYLPADQLSAIDTHLDSFENTIKSELAGVEPGVSVQRDTNGFDAPGSVFSKSLQSNVLNTLYSLPHGVLGMSNAVPGLVESSNNLAVVKTGDGEVSILTSQRSSVNSALTSIAETIAAVGDLASARVQHGNGYPAWQPNPDSALLKKATNIWGTLFSQEPEVKAIHAGLECGIIGDKYPGMEMISFGPTILGAHSPDERVHLPAVEKFWDFLVRLLAELAE